MANEAVIIELLGNAGDPMQYTVADGVAITKGTLMKLSADPRTMAATSADGDHFVGILATDKVADDGQVMMTVYTHCVADLKDSGAGVTLGAIAKMNGANLVATADQAGIQGDNEVVGQALETVAAAEVAAFYIRK